MVKAALHHLPKTLVFVAFVLGCLAVPVLIASLISFWLAPISAAELTILFVLCVAAAFFTWRWIYGPRIAVPQDR